MDTTDSVKEETKAEQPADSTESKEATEIKEEDRDEDEIFERDEDEGLENAEDEDDRGDVEEEHGKKVQMKVNINITNYKESKVNKEKKTRVDQKKEVVQDFKMLDLLFSFVGASSKCGSEFEHRVREHQLNLTVDYNAVPSRQFAGTVEYMPGENPVFFSHQEGRPNADMKQLLPVSCGYFLNIVRQLMSK